MAGSVRVWGLAGYTGTAPVLPARVRVFSVAGYVATVPASTSRVRVFSVQGISSLPGDAPVALAGEDLIDVEPWTTVDLAGSASFTEGASAASWQWSQLSGTPCTIENPTGQDASVEVPGHKDGETLTFGLVVTDTNGTVSNTATIDITTLPATELVVVGTVLVPIRISTVDASSTGITPLMGLYAHNEPWTATSHNDMQTLVGASFPRRSGFVPWDFRFNWASAYFTEAAAQGQDVMLAWQPQISNVPIPFSGILAGTYDSQIDALMGDAAAYPHDVIFRPFWEMNLNVAAYTMAYTGPDKQVTSLAQWIQVWQYIVNRQRTIHPSSNIKWYFCANGTDVGGYTMEQYYPGDSYVDEVGFDTYEDVYSPWTGFVGKITPMYNRFRTLAPSKPVVIGEIGCREDARKPAWIDGMFSALRNNTFPYLTWVCWFSQNVDADSDWRIDSSPESLAAFQRGMD